MLLVDDDEALLHALAKLLVREVGCPVETFADGAAALEFARATPPCLAVLDVDMGAMSGLELGRRLREAVPQLPIMFLTGSSQRDLAAEFASVGAVANLRKPVRGAELVEAVQLHRLRE